MKRKKNCCKLASLVVLSKHKQHKKRPGLLPTKAPAMPHLGAGVAQMAPGVAIPGTVRKGVKGGPVRAKVTQFVMSMCELEVVS